MSDFVRAGNVELPEDIRQKVLAGGVLQVQRVQKAVDAGLYACTARNKQGHTARRSAEVQVIGKPTLLAVPPTTCFTKFPNGRLVHSKTCLTVLV